MKHGRDHENRQSHVGHDHANNTPPASPDVKMEEAMISGRSGMFIKEGLIGAQAFQGHHTTTSATDAEAEHRTGSGSDVGPTKLAEAREQERHRLERKLGRTPAGEAGRVHDRRSPEVTRADLDGASRQADRIVIGHAIGSPPTAEGGPETPAAVKEPNRVLSPQ